MLIDRKSISLGVAIPNCLPDKAIVYSRLSTQEILSWNIPQPCRTLIGDNLFTTSRFFALSSTQWQHTVPKMSPNFLGEIMTSRHTTAQWPRYTQKGTRGDNRLNENVYRQLLTLLLIKNHYSEIIWNFGICPVLNLPIDEGEHKTGANISLYIYNYIQ